MPKKARCIAFTNHKGGTGKTTSCVSIAGFLAKSGHKTLVVDFDPQANATSALGIEAASLERSIYDVLLQECGHAGADMHEILLGTGIDNLHLAPSEFDLSAAEVLLLSNSSPAFTLSRILDAVRPLYDVILIDLPTSSGILTINGICAAEQIVVPFEPSIFSCEALDNLTRSLEMIHEKTGHSVDLSMALLTRSIPPGLFAWLRGKTGPCREIEAALKKTFATVFVIPESVEIYRSQQQGLPLSHYAPKCAAGVAYKEIARCIAEEKFNHRLEG